MRAAGDEHGLALGAQEQVLLVAEGIGCPDAALLPKEDAVCARQGRLPPLVRKEQRARQDLRVVREQAQARVRAQRRVQADLRHLSRGPQRSARAEGLGPDVDGRMRIVREERPQAAAVVVVPVRERGRLHPGHVCAQARRILEKERACAHVKEQAVPFPAQEQTQAVLTLKRFLHMVFR